MMTTDVSVRTAKFEDAFAGTLAILSGLVFAFVSLAGPLAFNIISYRTSPSMLLQGRGQDIVNLAFFAPICVIAGIQAFRGSARTGRWTAMLPVYLIYNSFAYGVGMEWSDPRYAGNSERFAFLFVFIMFAGIVLLPYALLKLKDDVPPALPKRGKVVYSVLFVALVAAFAILWIGSVLEIAITGTTAGYDEMPTGFWTIRLMDLGASIPLGFFSVYLLWTRPRTGFAVQLLFYGFFITQMTAVLGMVAVQLAGRDPLVTVPTVAVFFLLASAVYAGYFFLTKRRTA